VTAAARAMMQQMKIANPTSPSAVDTGLG
jgi:hypothetical protein